MKNELHIELENNKDEWLQSVLNGDKAALSLLYKAYRKPFVGWLMNYTNCSQDTALDIFQDSVIALYENIRFKGFSKFEKSIRNYLFGIGKRIYTTKVGKKKMQTTSLDKQILEVKDLNIPADEQVELDQQSKIILQLLKTMPQVCRSIIYRYYYRKMRLKDIASELKYKNENVVKVKKNQCMQKLKKATQKQYDREDL
ncbi:MAG: RNA polymerase sigma factor [Chitinophagales bacterium]